MVDCIRIAAAALNQTPLDWDGNAQRIHAALHQARDEQVSILCLPELCISGYGCEDAFDAPATAITARRVLTEISCATEGLIVSLGLPVLIHGRLYNGAALLADGQILGIVGKQNLAGDGLHYEPRWFRPWPNNTTAEIDVGGRSVPCGDLIFDCGGVRISFEICEDAWVQERPGQELARQGVDILLNPSASHFAFGKHDVRRQIVVDASRAFRAVYVYANLLGNEAGRAIYDGDAMVAADGTMLSTGRRLSFRDVELATAVVDMAELRRARAAAGWKADDLSAQGSQVVRADFHYPTVNAVLEPPTPQPWTHSRHLKHEEFLRAECLALFDYVRKSRSCGFVVSLSGGVDSAAVALLAARTWDLAARDLGMDALYAKLCYIAGIEQCRTPAQLTRRLLTCVYQATRNSSQQTRDAARQVADGLNAEFHCLDVEPLVDRYTALVSAAVGRRLTWDQDDIALQNIQARVRGPGVWMLANIKRALLLSTSNRSEAAVGYATMDGDTCGGLSPIAGIDKAFLRRWLVWMEQTGPAELGPFPPLALVNRQQPTAELRPSSAGQTDEADLMPYEILDLVERAAIRDKLSPLECLRRLESLGLDHPQVQLASWVEKFFVLWCRNQWKRERYAPSFHLDDENLDPKTWCRFPILSGGYQRELREMWAAVHPQSPS
jgi:NAD+ synthase (glutamine-hydrolysing)